MSAFDETPPPSLRSRFETLVANAERSSRAGSCAREGEGQGHGVGIDSSPGPSTKCSFEHCSPDGDDDEGSATHGSCRIPPPPQFAVCPASPPPDGEDASEIGGGGGALGRMSRVNRLKLQMCLSIGDVSHFQTHHTDETQATPCVDAAACEGMTEINNFLYLGSWRDSAESAVPILKEKGITHILNLAREHSAEGEPDRHPDLMFTTIPMNDDHQEDLYERLLEAHAFILAAKESGGKVLVHCRRGISRSPAIVVSFLMKYNRMSYEEAYRFVSDRRRVSLNLAFREFLGSWDPSLGRPPTSARMVNT